MQKQRLHLEERINKITSGSGSADIKRAGVASLKSDIAAIIRELESLWKMDKIKLPSKSELKQSAADTLKSAKPSARVDEKLAAWKEIYDDNGGLLYKTRSDGIQRFLVAQESDYAAIQASIGKQVLAVMEADKEWAETEKNHFATTWSDISKQRQDQILGALDLDKDVAKQLGDVANSAYASAWSTKFDGVATQLKQFIDRFEAIKSTLSLEGADKMLFAINAWADASYKQAGVEGSQNEISKAMEARQNRLAAIQSLVTAGALTEADAQRQSLQSNREALASLEPLVGVLQALSEIGYPPAIKAMEGFRSQLTDIRDQARDKTWLDGINQGLKDYSGAFNDTFSSTRDAVKQAFNGMENSLVQFVTKGKMDFSSLADSIIADLARIAIRQSITEPLASAMGSMNFASMFGFAQGGAPGGVSAWRNQIVDRPTFFAFASGGVMGEAGPEAIMPLKRGPGGRLGVDANGVGGNVQVIINNNVSGAQATTRERNEGGNRIIEVLLEQVDQRFAGGIARGGSASSAAIERTYGLNRVAGAY